MMGCVRQVSGEDVISEQEFRAWWEEQRKQREDGVCFFHVLRQEVAKRMRVPHVRRLQLVCDGNILTPSDGWMNAELTVVVRPCPAGCYAQKLSHAVRTTDLQELNRLLDLPCDPDGNRDISPLHEAVQLGVMRAIQFLLEAGADINKASPEGRTPLHVAAALSNGSSFVRRLVAASADLDRADNSGLTPMHLAVQTDRRATRFLVRAGADKDRADNSGSTPMHFAAASGNVEMVRGLLSDRASFDKVDNSGRLPRDVAENQEVAGLLTRKKRRKSKVT
ncbi:unnamed protein product [Effrenium voratum]|uniref:Uncharacterized protein n=1 Tax=Effrenium voratum TaxID=2562239 RepID=A0AA36IYE6_9DINO|nr:unnamed protein product [Effrenium voratum]